MCFCVFAESAFPIVIAETETKRKSKEVFEGRFL